MNNKQIECFILVCKYLNFTEAGERLYLSQPSVSRNISLLEEELGFDLLFRGNNFVRLTPAGSVMLDYFKSEKDNFSKTVEQAINISQGFNGTLKIGFMSNHNIKIYLMDRIKTFKKFHPKIQMNFQCYPVLNQLDCLTNKVYDVVFSHDLSAPLHADVISNVVYKTHTNIFIGKEHPLANKPDLCLSDLKNEIVWTTDEYDNERRHKLLQNIYNHYGITHWKDKPAPNWDTVLLNVQLGNGILFSDFITISSELSLFRIIEMPKEVSSQNIVVSWHKDNLNPIIAMFINEISSTNNE